MKTHTATLENSLAVHQKLKLELNMTQQFHSQGKAHAHTKTCTWIFTAAWFITAKVGGKNFHQVTDE